MIIPPGPSQGTVPTPSNPFFNTSNKKLPGHDIVMTLTIELIGVGVMAAIADAGSPAVGRMMVALMAGFFLIWFLNNASYFSSIVGKAAKYQ